MKKKLVKKDDIIELLIKKANGFYYTEEQLEYEKKQSKNLDMQLNMFDNFQNQKNANFDMNLLKNSEKMANNNKKCTYNAEKILQNNDKIVINNKNFNEEKNNVTGYSNLTKDDDIINLSSKNYDENFLDNNLILTKKKVSKHYVPPDMVAIKILFEMIENSLDSSNLESVSDEELLRLKNQLLEEIKNENI